MIAPDSSVLVAALLPAHAANAQARVLLEREPVHLVSHVALETASTLSRMPEQYRIAPQAILEALERASTDPWLVLDGEGYRSALGRAIRAGVRGGALYDALIAATASAHGATLLSADRRAHAVYEAMGSSVAYLEP